MSVDSTPAVEAVPEPQDGSKNQPPSETAGHGQQTKGFKFLLLCLTALGVVYGDIGTSPLYAVNESMRHVAPTRENIYGIISLVFWSLAFVVSFKYAMNILRAENHGEGGILALVALLRNGGNGTARRLTPLIVVGVFGACLLFGDGIITPAISVLSAVEGIEVATPALSKWVVPITVVIIVGLFVPQRFGTAKVGVAFGPVMLVWFFSIATTGTIAIGEHPEILLAINPYYAVRFVHEQGFGGTLVVLGSVVLTVTGCEALYADMGHFGRPAIRRTWFIFVKPALLLNYFGQGAWLLKHQGELMLEWQRHAADPQHVEYVVSAFYGLIRGTVFLMPMVALSTMATVVASQALISGAYSLTQQAQNLGFWPRTHITHTSAEHEGQIYVGRINWFLMFACLALVLGFRKSTGLAAAYGIAVTGTMVITSLLYYKVAVTNFGWNRLVTGGLVALFVLVDLGFLVANLLKFVDGGWVPAVVAVGFFTVMMTWFFGRKRMGDKIQEADQADGVSSFDASLLGLSDSRVLRPDRQIIFMVSNDATAAHLLGHCLKIFGVVPQLAVFFTVKQVGQPEVPLTDSIIECIDRGHGCWRVTATRGFRQEPNVEAMLIEAAKTHRLPISIDTVDGREVTGQGVYYCLGREQIESSGPFGSFFSWLSRSMAEDATRYFRLPPNKVASLGTQVEL